MKFMIGKSYRQPLDNDTYLDISIYPKKWTTTICMSLWERGSGVAIETCDRTYLNFEKLIPLKLAKKLGAYLINKQSQKLAKFDLVFKITAK